MTLRVSTQADSPDPPHGHGTGRHPISRRGTKAEQAKVTQAGSVSSARSLPWAQQAAGGGREGQVLPPASSSGEQEGGLCPGSPGHPRALRRVPPIALRNSWVLGLGQTHLGLLRPFPPGDSCPAPERPSENVWPCLPDTPRSRRFSPGHGAGTGAVDSSAASLLPPLPLTWPCTAIRGTPRGDRLVAGRKTQVLSVCGRPPPVQPPLRCPLLTRCQPHGLPQLPSHRPLFLPQASGLAVRSARITLGVAFPVSFSARSPVSPPQPAGRAARLGSPEPRSLSSVPST